MKSFCQRWNGFPVLTTDRLVLRQLEASDAPEFHRWICDSEVTRYLPWAGEPKLEESRNRILELRGLFSEAFVLPWGIAWKGQRQLIGCIRYCQFLGPRWSIGELAFELSRGEWRKGIMTEALGAAVGFGFETIGINRAQATCDAANAGSIGTLIKAGFTCEGTLRDWGWSHSEKMLRDHKMFSLLKRESPGDTFQITWDRPISQVAAIT